MEKPKRPALKALAFLRNMIFFSEKSTVKVRLNLDPFWMAVNLP